MTRPTLTIHFDWTSGEGPTAYALDADGGEVDILDDEREALEDEERARAAWNRRDDEGERRWAGLEAGRLGR